LLHVQRRVQLLSSEVQCAGCLILYVYIDNYIHRADPSKKFIWLKSHCHNLTAPCNTRQISCHATARRISWPT